MVVILMGVTGTGKTTVGEALADQLHWTFADADNFHSAANKAKMHAGIPLDDEDRAPWLKSLHTQIVTWLQQRTNGVLACSALKQEYRDALSAGIDAVSVRYVFLDGPQSVIQARLQQRHGHYMSPDLLPSQISTLEPPKGALRVSIEQTVPDMVKQIAAWLGDAGYSDREEKAAGGK